jgi:undecaprenyl-diphosphatase
MNYWRQSQLPFLFCLVVLFFVKVDQWFNHSRGHKIITYQRHSKWGCLPMPPFIWFPGFSRNKWHNIVGGIYQNLNKHISLNFVCRYVLAQRQKMLVYKDGLWWLMTKSICVICWYHRFFIISSFVLKFYEILSKKGFKVFGYYRIAAGIIYWLFIHSTDYHLMTDEDYLNGQEFYWLTNLWIGPLFQSGR